MLLRTLSFAALAATASAIYTLYKQAPDNAFKALSLDGSPSAFYFSPGSGDNANDWVFYFQGGVRTRASSRHSTPPAPLLLMTPNHSRPLLRDAGVVLFRFRLLWEISRKSRLVEQVSQHTLDLCNRATPPLRNPLPKPKQARPDGRGDGRPPLERLRRVAALQL